MADNDKTLQMPLEGGQPAGPDAPRVIGDFRVVQRIGAGAMGEVYLATHRETGQEAAIKVVSPRLVEEDGFLKRFEREIEALTKVDHPNIAKAITHGLHDGRPWLAMEFVRGPSLADAQRAGAMHEDAV